jgi:hypothetical protein
MAINKYLLSAASFCSPVGTGLNPIKSVSGAVKRTNNFLSLFKATGSS